MTSLVKTLSVAIAVLAISGCTTVDRSANSMYGASATDKTFGDSVREARMRQTIDLNAGSKHAATGSDAPSAQAAIKRYHKSFEKPAPTIKILGIGDR